MNGADAGEIKHWEEFVSETDLRKVLGNSAPMEAIYVGCWIAQQKAKVSLLKRMAATAIRHLE